MVLEIVLLREELHLRLYALDMSLQMHLSLIGRLGIGEVDEIGEIDLRVNDHIAHSVDMEEHVRTQTLAIIALQFSASLILHHILQLIVDAFGEALLRQYLIENCLSVVALHLRVVLEGSSQFDGTLSSRLGLLDDGLNACLHRAAELVLFL